MAPVAWLNHTAVGKWKFHRPALYKPKQCLLGIRSHFPIETLQDQSGGANPHFLRQPKGNETAEYIVMGILDAADARTSKTTLRCEA